jgi:hypothetical protein
MLMLDANGVAISPAMARRFYAQIALKFDLDDDPAFWSEMHPSQAAEWEMCGIPVQRFGPRADDPSFIPPKTFMNLPLELNPHLSPSVVLIRRYREIVGEIARLGMAGQNMEAIHG